MKTVDIRYEMDSYTPFLGETHHGGCPMSIMMLTNPGLYSKKVQSYKSGDFYTQKNIDQLNNAKTEGEYTGAMRKLEAQHRQNEKRSSVVDQGLSYARSLQESRTKAQDAALAKKKLQYNSKKISSQIVRSKTSNSARSAASAAKREVLRLKRLKGNEAYDQEEIEISIEHAKAMERVAKKKVHHLLQEEMIQRTGKGMADAIEESEEKKDDQPENIEDLETNPDDNTDASGLPGQEYRDYGAQMAANAQYPMDLQEEYRFEAKQAQEDMMAELQEISELATENTEAVSDMTEEMMEEMEQAMADMMEELDLTDLEQTMYAPDPNMSKEDLKMLKIKHRNKEMKDIVKADADYMKAMFDKHEADKAKGASGIPTTTAAAPALGSASTSSPAQPPQITIPPAYNSGGFSITI